LPGKPAGYLLAVADFKEPTSLRAQQALLAPLSDSYLLEITGHFSSVECHPANTGAPAAVLEQDENG
jgi:hypothetical protein